jgi:hypothetical protein
MIVKIHGHKATEFPRPKVSEPVTYILPILGGNRWTAPAGVVIDSVEVCSPELATMPEPAHCRAHLQFRSDCPECVSEREHAA